MEEWEEGGEEGEGGRTEVEMKWNICKYLPEAASCQDIFRVSCFEASSHIAIIHSFVAKDSFVPQSPLPVVVKCISLLDA